MQINSLIFLCWFVFPILWFLHKNDYLVKFSSEWKKKDPDDVVIPSITFFLLPFILYITYQEINHIFIEIPEKNNNFKFLDIGIKLIPITTVGTYFLDKIKKKKELAVLKDSLSNELYMNYLAVCEIRLFLNLASDPEAKLDGRPIKNFQVLWSDKIYGSNLTSINGMGGEVSLKFIETYQNAKIIANIDDYDTNSYYCASQNDFLIQRLDLLLQSIFDCLSLLGNKSEAGSFIFQDIKTRENQRSDDSK